MESKWKAIAIIGIWAGAAAACAFAPDHATEICGTAGFVTFFSFYWGD